MRENTSIRPHPINVLTSCFDTRYPLPKERLPNVEVTKIYVGSVDLQNKYAGIKLRGTHTMYDS